MPKSKFTPEMVKTIVESADKGAVNYFVCQILAKMPLFAAQAITARSISAKARSLGIVSVPVSKLDKRGRLVTSKRALVRAIEDATGCHRLSSLEKADKAALEHLVSALDTGALKGPVRVNGHAEETHGADQVNRIDGN